MTQQELNRQVASATGESISDIRRLGFSWADPDAVDHDPERAVRRPTRKRRRRRRAQR